MSADTRQRPPYLVTLARFAAGTRLRDLSDEAQERARWILADCVPVIAAGGAVLFLGESATWRLVLAGTAILGGVTLALSARRKLGN